MRAEPLEMFWTVVVSVGLFASTFGFVQALVDIRTLKRSGKNGARLIVAKSHIRTEAIRVFVQALFTIAGGAALFEISEVSAPARISTVVVQFALIASALALTVNSVLDLRVRRRLLEALDHEEERRET